MTAINIFLGIMAGILLLFAIGETRPPMSKGQRTGAIVAFVAVLTFIAVLNIFR